MPESSVYPVCRSCGFSGAGKFCSQCGQAYLVKRITLHALLHDIIHLFTHLEKGFLFTIRQLVVAPGSAQKNYIEGDRIRYQKPFAMFFICATISGLCRYFSLLIMMNTGQIGVTSEAEFWHQGMVILQIVLMPFFILFTYILFRNTKFNYAELGVLLLYTFSIFFLIAALLSMARFVWTRLDIAYIEFPLYLIYFVITFVNFFKEDKKWMVFFKSLLLFIIMFLLIQVIEDFVIEKFY